MEPTVLIHMGADNINPNNLGVVFWCINKLINHSFSQFHIWCYQLPLDSWKSEVSFVNLTILRLT